jgi:hypothetical protein
MTLIPVNRRQIMGSIAGLGLGALVPSAGAQEVQGSPGDAGSIHGDMLRDISKAVGGKPITEKDGLYNLVALLAGPDFELIGKPDQDVLRKLIDIVFGAPTADEMMKQIEELEKSVSKTIGELAAAIIRIARSSIQYAREKAKEHPQIVKIVVSDVSGAMSGATAAKKFGKRAVLICATAGAIGSSALTALGVEI